MSYQIKPFVTPAKIVSILILFFYSYLLELKIYAQVIPAGYPVLEDALRRKQLAGEFSRDISFSNRPIQSDWAGDRQVFPNNWEWFEIGSDTIIDNYKGTTNILVSFLPLRNSTRFAQGRPSGHAPGMLSPSVGWQSLWSAGVEFRWKFIHAYFQPEFHQAQNKRFTGFDDTFPLGVNLSRTNSWWTGDIQELFWDGSQTLLNWGNSKIALQLGAFEAGVSTQNIWWGPGQFHALTFSNASQGFPHVSINTHRPAKTFVGNFEGQLLAGALQSRFLRSSQSDELNNLRKEIPNDWRYVNALTITYSPKWIPNLFVGATRTFQQFNDNRGNTIWDWLPVIEPFQKERFFDGGNTIEYDDREQDQQATVFSRVFIPKAKAELYVEFGKRDHNLNWRETILNPEHARAYILGFNKLFHTPNKKVFYQLRGEMVQTSSSINQIVRYNNLTISGWHMHAQVFGFKNYGQFLGLNQSMIGNSQILEVSRIKGLQKIGLMFERIENNQDFFRRAFEIHPNPRPWIDFSAALLLTHRFGPVVADLRLQSIHAYNYQWAWNHPDSSNPFGSVPRRTDFLMQWHLYYMIPDGLLRKKD